MNFETQLLHNGNEVDPVTGAVGIPLYQSSTFHQDVDRPGEFDYTRSGNPTRKALEDTIANLEGGERGFAFSSGMAAISTVLLLFSRGDHLIVSRDVYGGTFRVLTQVFRRLGIETTFVDTTRIGDIEQAIRPQTKAIYVETPSNPLLKVSDLKEIIRLAKKHRCLTIVDNTFLTPYYQQPLKLGADIVIHSATKFISGHSDVLAGLVVAKDKETAQRLELLQNAFGAVLGVHDSWLVLRGLKTLKVRLEQSTQSAEKIALWLSQHPLVEQVYYPGLPSNEWHDLQCRQATGHGAVLSFDVGSKEKARQVLKRVRLPVVAVSLGAVESILSYPAAMSHASMPPEARQKRGITDGLLRLSVGLENVEDLIGDLAAALQEEKVVSFSGK
ncbi:aminotransferase class I/II-fold pyridoxal phosphate-dependent enzyme [Thermoactinomyces intermedius]|uniref:cysteine-S-conjugate beta-lyase n=1 Tax=Thermoactinomyces intermedius TaxID=2024 RepID=A0A8I1DDR1_THEIN|nr:MULTISPECIES: aminotransferase class I/II-fold pyridoxal phosphate-dependent enzyme [Thermoactinomyces]MBA4547786.1 aminotransferase class I/II-fold pyridoxal phosphate-dependent enzyme [Thermoactinomyces intermedius]MBA4836603.1 aminotransferase class I/II-fold pyridoxal phosphate-dependent enzyme [Thermoactinomyces intermedius]MBH8593985.1 aminotransferase class I/II-fold pyridoxal phosphate-dependent enzyme [Thermoactinomyces intermedius]MBH8600033.1 aminotransferase class I/II-fold pyrid